MSQRKNSIINVRIDDDLKIASKEILEKNNLDHSKSIRLLLEFISKHKDIPDFMKKTD
jgi:addiction module RelB/DinJ family antitoxin